MGEAWERVIRERMGRVCGLVMVGRLKGWFVVGYLSGVEI